VEPGDGDRRLRNHRTRLIDNRDDQLAVACRLLGRRPLRARARRLRERGSGTESEKTDESSDGAPHLRTSNFFGSILTLILKPSKVVSSTVSGPTARRSRNG